jgi:hypothetical protein
MKHNNLLITTVLTIALFIASANNVTAQSYRNALGFRVGSPFGMTFKHLFNEHSGLELIVGTRGRSAEVIGLYEYHIYPAKKAPEFDLYFGGGAHVGFYGPRAKGKDRGPFYGGNPYWSRDEAYLGVGLDGIVGCSYTFKNAPVNLGIDYKPAISLNQYIGYLRGDLAISVRFVLN